jgi:ribosomal protein S18 acetylase RimI-like enzyme
MLIRKTKKEDIPQLVKIFRTEKAKKPYSQKLTQKEARDKIKGSLKDKEVYTLEIDGKAEGFFICEIRAKKKQVYLDELWISRKNQGKGYGKSIMKFIEKNYSKKGIKEITLVADKNANASKFYKKIGYRIKNEWLHMAKNIK